MSMNRQSSGFTLVEVIVALFILSVGLLAMGASTGHVMAQIQSAELKTERIAAIRQAAETLRSTGWSSLENACSADPYTSTDHFDVSCSVTTPYSDLKRVRVITSGPGFRSGRLQPSVADTFALNISEPVQ